MTVRLLALLVLLRVQEAEGDKRRKHTRRVDENHVTGTGHDERGKEKLGTMTHGHWIKLSAAEDQAGNETADRECGAEEQRGTATQYIWLKHIRLASAIPNTLDTEPHRCPHSAGCCMGCAHVGRVAHMAWTPATRPSMQPLL